MLLFVAMLCFWSELEMSQQNFNQVAQYFTASTGKFAAPILGTCCLTWASPVHNMGIYELIKPY